MINENITHCVVSTRGKGELDCVLLMPATLKLEDDLLRPIGKLLMALLSKIILVLIITCPIATDQGSIFGQKGPAEARELDIPQ